jgi:hypothetical protein
MLETHLVGCCGLVQWAGKADSSAKSAPWGYRADRIYWVSDTLGSTCGCHHGHHQARLVIPSILYIKLPYIFDYTNEGGERDMAKSIT